MAQDVTRAREHLIAALEADLIGPYEKPGGLDVSDELLKLPPSRWYLTGFLAPMEAREVAEPQTGSLAQSDPISRARPGRSHPGPGSELGLLPGAFAMSDRTLVDVALADLELLARALEGGRVDGLDPGSLQALGLGHLAGHLAPIDGLDANRALPALAAVIAERQRWKPPGRLDREVDGNIALEGAPSAGCGSAAWMSTNPSAGSL